MSISNVALLGADGKLGAAVLQALISSSFNVTVLKREGSKSPDDYAPGVNVSKFPDEMPVEALTKTLQHQDALVVTIKGSQTDVMKRLADACVKAGVKRYIPADFGSCDSSSPLTQELVPLYKRKTELREYLMQLAHQTPSFSWTGLVCGHFFDWSLEFIHVWPKEKRAEILDDGETKFSVSTLAQTAEATARVLQRPAETQNKMLFVQSFCVTQNEIIRAYEKVMGSQWQVKRYDAEAFKNEQKAKADGGDLDAIEHLVWYLGTVDADWTTREGFAMRSLGLKDEDLEQAVKKTVESL